MIVKKRYNSSKSWLRKHFSDKYVKQAHEKKLRSRAYFKLEEIQKKEKIFYPGMDVLDLGSSPGSWSQYAAKCIQPHGYVIACDILPMKPMINVKFFQGDIRKTVLQDIFNSIDTTNIQVVMSDMAPNISGIPNIDIPNTIYLVESALKISVKVLSDKGSFLVKIFQGEGFNESFKKISLFFRKVKIIKPNASYLTSREVYILAKQRKL
ncbi:23S rRNA (uridine(2552)-2'-O)-methyltransferase RlmE [Candidatus Ishikawella capsulata]|nr:23S rRNA (uridine(2552)-2'-O)-methyltransferase RlmE [Candidatus Ishikawaella capsulata]